MRLIRAPLPVEIHRGIAGIVGRLTTAGGPLKTLLARPRFEQRAIDREVLVGHGSTTSASCLSGTRRFWATYQVGTRYHLRTQNTACGSGICARLSKRRR